MKAIICTAYGSPEVLKLKDVAKPVPGNNEVCIKMKATAVTASDCIVRGFKIPRWQPLGIMMGLALGFTKPRQPIIGMIVAGEIESIGKNVKSFKTGEKVFGWDLFPAFGTYAEYKCMKEKGILTLIPENTNYDEAAAIPYGGLMALPFLKKANLQEGQKVLIYGASGAIGTSAVQLARHFGTIVTGVCSTANMDLVKSLGADKVIDYTQNDKLDNDEVFDFVFDAVGKNKKSRLKTNCKKALTPSGRYISVDDVAPVAKIEDLLFLAGMIKTGHLKAVIDSTYPLEEIIKAHRYVDQGHKKGSVIIRI